MAEQVAIATDQARPLESALGHYDAMSDKNEMAKEYDFSGGERGKFYRPEAKSQIPVYLEPDTHAFVEEIARRRGTDVSEVVNGLLKADRDLLNELQ